MAFRDIVEQMELPEGASERYRRLEALERQLDGADFYKDLHYAFEQEKEAGRPHIPMRERRPSVVFALAHEITQDTQAELFGDEQFPIVRAQLGEKQNDDASEEIENLIRVSKIDDVVFNAYWEGVVGSVAVIIQKSDDGSPYYDIQPGKYCEPIYASRYSNNLVGLVVTYPVQGEELEKLKPGAEEESKTWWYRFVVGTSEQIDYHPLKSSDYVRLGEKDPDGTIIEFRESKRFKHGFAPRVPVVWTKNLGRTFERNSHDGPALWWPVRDMLIEADYNLSQVGRGLRYSADPMLFVKKGDLNFDVADVQPLGYAKEAGATLTTESGEMVKGVTQTILGEDAKLLEITGQGIKEEREFVKDLREYALEIIGGQKSSAQHEKGNQSGKALQRLGKPLRRVVRRQRRPYGDGLLLELIDLTLYGLRNGAIKLPDVKVAKIPKSVHNTLEWPNDDEMVGTELLAHVSAIQIAGGAPLTAPKELINPEALGAKLAADLGMHESSEQLKGSLEPQEPPAPPLDPNNPKPSDDDDS